jgi:hypothetical protein
MSPSLSRTVQPGDPINVEFPITWPETGAIDRMTVYRSEDDGPYYLLVGVPKPATLYVDTFPAGHTNATEYVSPVLCNESGRIPAPVLDAMVKGFVQPIQSTRATRLTTEYIEVLFGNIQADDHLGIFPVEWEGIVLDFSNWSQSADDYLEYNGDRYFVVNANLIPDPGDGNPEHHWELGLRKIDKLGLSGEEDRDG